MKKLATIVVFICMITFFAGLRQAGALPIGASLIDAAGFKWLSPVYSTGISFEQMLAELMTAGSDYYGLRFASSAEVTLLAVEYGLETPTVGTAMDLFQNDFGITQIDTVANLTRGFVDQAYPPGPPEDPALLAAQFINMNDPAEMDIFEIGAFYIGDPDPRFGSWLVLAEAQPVPEPTTIILFGTGLAAMAYNRRKAKK